MTYLIFMVLGISCSSRHHGDIWQESQKELAAYRSELDSMRAEFRECDMPGVPFFLFGMGDREKYLYKNGQLIESFSGKVIKEWSVNEELIVPSLYRVVIKTDDGEIIVLQEDEEALWLIDDNDKRTVIGETSYPVSLPSFSDARYSRILKVLHQEILVNIVDGMPLPNYFVYKNGWRRDGAMMAMCLQQTGNAEFIKSWVMNLSDPYDRNNAGEMEADNLGQTLYLLSLFVDKEYPLVQQILKETKKYEKTNAQGKYIQGRSDFHETPVYQTKFLKWGLKQLGLEDDYIIPEIEDDYASLFWWDYKDTYVSSTKDAYNLWKDDKYPYIGWAADHFHGLKRNPISNRDYPLTWEIEASQADYQGMRIIDEQYVEGRNASPHTWHAAEVFLYLLDLNQKED
ncbi:MAG: hypothetical protein PUB21_12250 [Bacteroidales bacterium]|nr:hypothetical protein [Bacteroidales bacterium]